MKNININNLVKGKVYQCYDDFSFRNLIWYSKIDKTKTEVLSNSIFIFLDSFTKHHTYDYKTVTIKGLVDGKLLYAIDCSTTFTYHEIK